MTDGPVTLTIPEELAGARLDKALATLLPELSRARIQALLVEGAVGLDNGSANKGKDKVAEGDVYTVLIPPAEEARPEAQDIPLDILHEDEHLIVLHKPVGLVCHPAPGAADGTLVNALLYHCGDSLSGIGGVKRPGIVHRLDKDTSGLMVVAKTDHAHQYLSAQFADRSLSRGYVAFCYKIPAPREGRIDAPIGRSLTDRKKMSVRSHTDGKPAATRYEVEEIMGTHMAAVACQLETGRTHQVRVHLTHIGCPIIGDRDYGQFRLSSLPRPLQDAVRGFPRQALHARSLTFLHPADEQPRSFSAPLPSDMAALRDRLAEINLMQG
ncbi:MAG: RluA family pseudouridine synthase [Alphaproteobacteria bacterium]